MPYSGQGTVFSLSQAAPGGLAAETYSFAPDDFAAPALVLVLHVTNGTAASVAGGSAFLFVSPSVGGGAAGISGETVAYGAASDSFTMSGAAGTLLAASLSPSSHHGQSPSDVVGTVAGGGDLPGGSGPFTQDDAAAAWQWPLPALGPGRDAWFGAVLVAGTGEPAALDAWIAGRTPQALLAAQEAHDTAALAAATLPAGLSAAEQAVARQQLSVLQLAQVEEPDGDGGTPHGALVASLPPGEWRMTWVRDSCYAAVALARAGRVAQAADALSFLLKARVGGYRSYVGVPYGVSVCRHYGDGEEWSDSDQDGPNVELDGFGLTLWAAGAVLAAGGETAKSALAPYAGRLIDLLAVPLTELSDATGLISADSSIWEVHWDGRERHFTYTDAAAVAGLSAAPAVASAFGLADPGFAEAAGVLARTMQEKLVDGEGAFAGTLEGVSGEGDDRDAAAVEVYALAGLDPAATIAAVEGGLAVASGFGYRRDDGGSSYDDAEWAFIDLRLAAADFGVGRAIEGEKLLDRVTAAAQGAYGLIPELYDPVTGAYAGAVPMVGYGAGAYLLALQARAAGVVPPADWSMPDAGTADAGLPGAGTDAGATGGGATDAGIDESAPPAAGTPAPSCGCRSAGEGPFVAAAALLFLLLARKRKRAG